MKLCLTASACDVCVWGRGHKDKLIQFLKSEENIAIMRSSKHLCCVWTGVTRASYSHFVKPQTGKMNTRVPQQVPVLTGSHCGKGQGRQVPPGPAGPLSEISNRKHLKWSVTASACAVCGRDHKEKGVQFLKSK